MLEHVEQSMRGRRLFRHDKRVLVAVSGGVDSMVLLRLLDTLAKANDFRIIVAHFNHRLRPRSSDADERLVRRTARTLGWPVIIERGEVKAFAREHRVSIEMAARELRHAFLSRIARRLKVRSVALAHHADDQVELFFLRLLRGAGGEGVAGMKWLSRSPANSATQLVRPLLDISKADLKKFARQNNIRFREDASNASRDFLRNRIRHELLPLLRRRFQPALDKVVLRLMDIVGAESEVVADAAKACLKLDRRSLTGWPVGLQRRIIQLQLHQRKIAADFELVEWLRSAVDEPITIGPGLAACCDAMGRVAVRKVLPDEFNDRERPVQLAGRAGEITFAGGRIRWRYSRQRSAARPSSVRRQEFFDADKVGPRILLRHWRPGDRYQPIGMPAHVKLQDWFTNQKISRRLRRELIIATTAGGEIFWIEGQRIGETFKLTPGTKRRLVWRWERR